MAFQTVEEQKGFKREGEWGPGYFCYVSVSKKRNLIWCYEHFAFLFPRRFSVRHFPESLISEVAGGLLLHGWMNAAILVQGIVLQSLW